MILDHAQKRGDSRALAEYRRGYWKGVAQSIWIVGFVACGAALLGFNIALWSV